MPAVVKDRIWPHVGYDPHDGQREVHNSLARFRALAAGRRFGKSLIGGHELVPEAALTYHQLKILREIGIKRRFWIAGPDYSDVDKEFRVLWDDLKRLGFAMMNVWWRNARRHVARVDLRDRIAVIAR